MMLRGLWKLTWIEIKVFLREPLGAIGNIIIPVVVFIVTGRLVGRRLDPSTMAASNFIRVGLPVLASLLIVLSAVLSLVTIISIYREGGILKRLRATPLRPQTILTAHVIVKLLLTAATLVLMVLAGKRYYPVGVHVHLFSFTIALLICTWSILSIGFLIASIVPTARFAQPIGATIMYPMVALSGLFTPDTIAAAIFSRAGTCGAAHLRGGAASGNLEWRFVVRARRRRGRAGADFCVLHRALRESVSLGVTPRKFCAARCGLLRAVLPSMLALCFAPLANSNRSRSCMKAPCAR